MNLCMAHSPGLVISIKIKANFFPLQQSDNNNGVATSEASSNDGDDDDQVLLMTMTTEREVFVHTGWW